MIVVVDASVLVADVQQGRLTSEQGEKLLGVVHDFAERDVIKVTELDE